LAFEGTVMEIFAYAMNINQRLNIKNDLECWTICQRNNIFTKINRYKNESEKKDRQWCIEEL
jgi:hypothetical protein